MTQITNTVFWKTNSSEREEAIVFRRNMDNILENVEPPKNQLSDEQEQYHLHLQQATIYAKTQMLNKDAKAMYEAKVSDIFETAYTIAVADFLNAPDIKEVDLTKYSGKVGDTIRIQVTDDFKVAYVKITIINQGGEVLEDGNAIHIANSHNWIYTITASNINMDGDKILIQASDLPGNITKKEQSI